MDDQELKRRLDKIDAKTNILVVWVGIILIETGMIFGRVLAKL